MPLAATAPARSGMSRGVGQPARAPPAAGSSFPKSSGGEGRVAGEGAEAAGVLGGKGYSSAWAANLLKQRAQMTVGALPSPHLSFCPPRSSPCPPFTFHLCRRTHVKLDAALLASPAPLASCPLGASARQRADWRATGEVTW